MSDDDSNAVDKINRILAEGLANTERKVYHCDYCNTVYDSGRKARQHGLTEHGGLDGYRSEVIE